MCEHEIDPSPELRELAARQAGAISGRQAGELGLTKDCVRRLLRQGHWQRLTAGVLYAGPDAPPWLAQAWTGILLGGSDARLGFAAAGHLWGLVDDPPEEIAVLVPFDKQVAARGRWTFPRERPGARSGRSRSEPPRTSAADTVIDLCADAEDEVVVEVITKAVQRRLVTAADLLESVQGRRRLAKRSTMVALLADVGEGAESPLELRYVDDVERAHGLPTAKRQHRTRGRREVRDALYEDYATLVELDGQVHALQQLRDMRRDNRALLDGQVTLRYGWPDVTGTPCQVAWQVAAIPIARGWTGYPTRCPRCVSASDADMWRD